MVLNSRRLHSTKSFMVFSIKISQNDIGLPLKKMAPQNEQDLLFKLSQKFTSAKDLLNFFESNRDVFTISGTEAYKLMFSRLTGFKMQANAPKNANKATIEIIMEP